MADLLVISGYLRPLELLHWEGKYPGFQGQAGGTENDMAVGEVDYEKNNRTGKRLRLAPFILGGYGAFFQ